MTFLYALFMSVVLVAILVPVCTEIGIMFFVMDTPDEKKSLKRPLPKLGGIAIVLAACTSILIWDLASPVMAAFLISAGILVLSGTWEDFQGPSTRIRLSCQILAALIIVSYGGIRITCLETLLPDGVVLPDWLAVSFTTGVIVAATNAVKENLAGLAAGTGVVIFGGIGYLAYLTGDGVIGLACISLCGALFGFLRFNACPASILMGSSGRQFLGFSTSIFTLATTQGAPSPISILPLVLFAYPLLDLLLTTIVRIRDGNGQITSS